MLTHLECVMRIAQYILSACLTLIHLPAASVAQTPSDPSSLAASTAGQQSPRVLKAIDLAAKGDCEEALPLLKKLIPDVKERQLKYKALMATVRCSMNRAENQTTANTLLDLKREFPEDPEVLYMTSQFFLSVAESASQELATVAPNSYQTRELQAETLESQEKWAEAIQIYRKILEEHPKLRGIHYRLGRAALSQTESPVAEEDAKKEFEQELTIDPVNAGAEYWLGEIARRQGQWDTAVLHFTSAAKLNSTFADALLAIGTTLNSAGRPGDAIAPLEQYVKMSPKALAGHYQLSIAYARTGRKEDSAREMAIHHQMIEKSRAAANSSTDAAPN